MRKVNPLLQDIKKTIKDNGGNAPLALQIMLENRNLFSMWEIGQMHRRVKNLEKSRRYFAKHTKPNDFWSVSDICYVLDHYGTMETRLLAAILNRTGVAVRDAFNRLASPEKKEWVRLHGRYAGRIDNFKKK